ncbi:TetR/AcrR family transcriptional regulator [Actinocorallia sp. API 0066]|uniref:TetR/AcrR family transcriptional regulator n=1 Tax=Actinocorallia sp. API 0066 TaxID=2896846 RepID=UPI001E4D2A7A|nr:TetR/AcrR family transcriptional regulator [Actinocorallia sp. API 0066]MCD0451432.1 TetR/AcrR family transcriptional regulator [Actinocorallia sp. API 0066]
MLEAAQREFGAHGYSTGSLNTIAREADIAKGSLFQYFSDKLEFFTYVAEETARRIREEMELGIAALDPDQSFTHWLGDVGCLWADYFAAHPLERAVTAAMNLEIDNTVRTLVRGPSNQHYRESISPLLARWRERGEIRADLDDDTALALLMIVLPHLALAPYYDGLDPILGLRGKSPEEQYPIIRTFVATLGPIFEPKH